MYVTVCAKRDVFVFLLLVSCNYFEYCSSHAVTKVPLKSFLKDNFTRKKHAKCLYVQRSRLVYLGKVLETANNWIKMIFSEF